MVMSGTWLPSRQKQCLTKIEHLVPASDVLSSLFIALEGTLFIALQFVLLWSMKIATHLLGLFFCPLFNQAISFFLSQ